MTTQTILDPNGKVIARIRYDPNRNGLPWWLELASDHTARTDNHA